MKIKSIEIQNFRSIKRETLDCTQFNSFVGPNGSGKSTVLNALNVFFGEINSFSEEDFHNRDTSDPIVIKITFHQLSDDAADEFGHYVRAGLLVVQSEVAVNSDGSFKKLVRGERLVVKPTNLCACARIQLLEQWDTATLNCNYAEVNRGGCNHADAQTHTH